MSARGVRLARGWAGAAAATFAAALSHVLAGGEVPGLPVFRLSLALSGLICSLLAGRVLSLWRMSTAVILSQGLFHWLFSAGASSSGAYVVTTTAGTQAGHLDHDMTSMTLMAVGNAPSSMAQNMDHNSPLMLLCHAIAALFTIAALRRGEQAGVRLLQALRLRLVRFLPALASLPVRPRTPSLPSHWPVRVLTSLGVPLLAMRHRGPPLCAVVSTSA